MAKMTMVSMYNNMVGLLSSIGDRHIIAWCTAWDLAYGISKYYTFYIMTSVSIINILALKFVMI